MISFTPYSSELCSLWAFFDFFCQTRRVKISTKIYSIMILGMITLDQYLMGREVRFPITDEYKDNALILLDKISELEHIFGETLTMTSGYRPSQINRQTPGASLTSTHETCEGIDLRDISGELGQFLITNVNILKALDLYMESPKSAKDHVHLQIRPPKSGRRIFLA